MQYRSKQRGVWTYWAACALLGMLCVYGNPLLAQESNQNGETDTGSSMADTAADEDSLAKDASTEINVKNADLTAIVRIFSKKTRRNFILDERVKGKVSIYLPGKVSTDESLRILDSVLAYKGFAAVPMGPNLWKIVPAKEARTTTIPTQRTAPDGTPGPEVVTRLVQLKFVGADEVRQLVSQLISADGFISAYPSTNSLILIDSEDNIERLIDIINTLDVPFSNREMTIIPIVHAEAKDIADKLSEILGLNTTSAASGASAASSPLDFGLELARARVRQLAMQSASQTGGQVATAPGQSPATSGAEMTSSVSGTRSMQPKIIADERTNSIIVVGDEDTTARVQALISQLDSKIDLSGAQYWIYRCQHAKAEELADVLGGLVGEGGSSKSSSDSGGGGLFDTGQDLISGGSRMDNRSRTQNRIRGQNRTPGQSRSQGQGSRGVSSVELGENFSITADPSTNTLIIFSNKTDYQKIRGLLDKIDIKRRQVLVEAMLLEVGIDETRTMDVSWLVSGGGADGGILAGNNPGDIASLLESPQGVQDFAIAVASAGTLTIGGGDSATTLPTQSLLLNAVRSNSRLNLLSAPTILTTDNEEAEIVVGQNVPFITSTATDNNNLDNTFNQVERQDVGITLRLTPQISSADSVTLKIFTEVSNVQSVDPSLGPTTSVRTSETSVITKDGQMIVIGGLMGDGINESERGVPYLADIPLLGHLFKTTSERRNRTNLLILITPRIIRDQYDARDATIDRRDELSGHIAADDHYPDRSDLLHDPRIDKVSEANTYEGPTPSTIFDPNGKLPPPAQAAPPNSLDTDTTALSAVPRDDSDPSDSVLEFTVEPKFAPSEGATVEDAPNSAHKENSAEHSPRAELNSSLSFSAEPSPSRAVNEGGARFVVLEAKSKPPSDNSIPFKLSGSNRLVGIIVPGESAANSSRYFSVGNECEYQTSNGSLQFTIAGVFPSIKDASLLYPELAVDATKSAPSSAWYTLSPYEIMSLGEGPWK